MRFHRYRFVDRIPGTKTVLCIVALFLATASAQGLENSQSLKTQQPAAVLSDALGDFFVHTATAPNIASNWTYIDHPLTNGNPDALVMITQNWNPGGAGGIYNDHSMGIWYDTSAGKWGIFNQDLAAMTGGASFNVLIPSSGAAAFAHTATAANIASNSTYIDHPATNSNPNALVMVTQNWNPGAVGGTYNDHSVGVWYDTSAEKWAVFNQDLAAMPEGAAFNVLIPGSASGAFTHTATAANISSNWTYIDHPGTNSNPDALVMVTQNWNPAAVGGTYNDHSVGVWYDTAAEKWAIFNQSLVAMPEGAAVNVVTLKTKSEALVHMATAANIASNWTYIDHPAIDSNPNALVMVTQNWNPGAVGGTYNDHSVGVWYDTSAEKWAVFNQDLAAMPEEAAFNVLIPGSASGAFTHTATAANISSNWTYIDHPGTNSNPNALVTVTQNWNPGAVGGTYNDHSVGVWYDTGVNKWAIFNQDLAAMTEGAAFNVLIFQATNNAFVHTSTAANISSNWTYIDHSSTNGNPDALVMVTQNWNPGATSGTYNDHSVGVWYDTSAEKWAVFNQDLAAMPEGAAFNVSVHTSLAVNVQAPATVPTGFHLAQNYPNPFNPETTIQFVLPRNAIVTLRVFDLLGREVAVLLDDELAAGEHRVVFDATGLPSGVYFYRLRAVDRSSVSGHLFDRTKRLMLLK